MVIQEIMERKIYSSGTFKKNDLIGFTPNSKYEDVLVPIIEELEALELAKEYLKEYSYREVAGWLSDRTGREISHIGLRKRIQKEKQRKSKATTYKTWLKNYQKALEKLEEIESKRIGAKKETGSREAAEA